MAAGGWQQLFQDWSWVRGEGRFPIPAYSEFMPPPRIGQKPYGHWEVDVPFARDDPWGWTVSAAEREREIDPGLAGIAKQLSEAVVALATGQGAHKIGRYHLEDNPYWPKALAERSASLDHERYLFLSPLALSKTQDDKGRVRWTLFGASHLGPALGFWNSFFTAPGAERAESESLGAMRRLLQRVYGEAGAGDLRAAGFRVMSTGALSEFPELEDGPLPAWARSFVMGDADTIEQVRYLLTFRPFALLPEPVQRAYLAGRLHLLPSPVSMVFWGSPLYRKLDAQLPFARQIMLLQSVARHASPKVFVCRNQAGFMRKGTRMIRVSGKRNAAIAAHIAGNACTRKMTRRSSRERIIFTRSCSAAILMMSASMASRWRGIRKSGPAISKPFWTGRTQMAQRLLPPKRKWPAAIPSATVFSIRRCRQAGTPSSGTGR
jgi:hypothetical protein